MNARTSADRVSKRPKVLVEINDGVPEVYCTSEDVDVLVIDQDELYTDLDGAVELYPHHFAFIARGCEATGEDARKYVEQTFKDAEEALGRWEAIRNGQNGEDGEGDKENSARAGSGLGTGAAASPDDSASPPARDGG